jgi:hypothetical protein
LLLLLEIAGIQNSGDGGVLHGDSSWSGVLEIPGFLGEVGRRDVVVVHRR